MRRLTKGTLLSTSAALFALPVLAQDDVSASEDASASGRETIIVTAQRREENLQEVPLSVAVVSAAALEKSNIQTLEQFLTAVPGVNITQEIPPRGAQTFIRGVGNIVGLESSVGLYTDGIYQPMVLSALLRLNDIERVEVLKGPQGTLFGRNSTAGAIQLVTRKPADEFDGNMSIGYGNFDTFDANAYLTTPIGESVQTSIAVTYKNQAEGWGDNLLRPGEDIYRDRYFLGRGKINFDLTDRTSLLIGGHYVDAWSATASSTGGGFPGATVGATLDTTPPIIYPNPTDFYDGRAFLAPFRESQAYGVDARLEHELPFANLISITAYQSAKENSRYGGVDIDSFAVNSMPDMESFSQELQLQSLPDSPLQWQAGVYYLDFSIDVISAVFSTSLAGNGLQLDTVDSVESIAGYAQATYEFPSRTSITAGVRYTHDSVKSNPSIDFTSYREDPNYPEVLAVFQGPEHDVSTSFEKVTWRVAVDQKFADHMAYASVSTGYKAGFFASAFFDPPNLIQPETNINYEAGLKMSWDNDRFLFNVAAFWNDLKNVQVSAATLDPMTGSVFVTVANAAKARSRGFDIEAVANDVVDGLSLRASAQILDPTYRRFPNAVATAPSGFLETRDVSGVPTLFVPGCSTPATGIRPGNGGNTDECLSNATGNQLILASKFVGLFGFTYDIPLGDAALSISGDVTYNHGYYWDAPNIFRQPSFTVANGSVRYDLPESLAIGAKTSIVFWMRNITGEKYWSSVRFNPGPQGTLTHPAEPRAYGVILKADF